MAEAIKDTDAIGNRWRIVDEEEEVFAWWASASVSTPEEAMAQYVALQAESSPLAEAKAAACAGVTNHREGVFAGGYSPASGPLSGHTLQCRDVQDRTNWLTSQAAYSLATAAGQGATEGATFRTMANETVTVSYNNAMTVLIGMMAWGETIMHRSWELKDAIDACTTVEAVEAIDITAGWPS